MPFVRIHHPSGNDPLYPTALSKGVHRALVDVFGIPQDDYFQALTSHNAGTELIGPAEFMGITHSDDLVIIQITCAEGRTTEQKKALYEAIAENVSNDAGVPRDDVIINLVETKRENWSFGNGHAPFA
ncbi:4-oxalocrotonate tautomerase [Kiloniella litopenaei]|uniref:4-oxalocrotonate tautomerase n=1 Tax=Kiloniella litopenaei TaxID=1549748 RepID=A0A0M2RDY3_9PROT|nr:tautomerase family protein [Kiloniella litopenaei]KKJ78200.1 4-oxalocrotonate tautomerase [Kiloniella litopenaei]